MIKKESSVAWQWYRCGTVTGMKEDIHIRIDEDVMSAVRAYAASHGVSLAAAVSVLLRQALRETS
jgi:hypothetical protein